MFDKIKTKFNKDQQRPSRAISETSTLDIPIIIEPSSTPSGYRSRWASMSSIPDTEYLSTPTQSTPTTPRRSISRGRSQSTSSAYTPAAVSQAAPKSRGRRKRDIFWGSNMWDASSDSRSYRGRGSVVRAKSSSRPVMHPEVFEEKMRQDNWRA